jgi:GT2 family glycosyltransferase
MISIVTVYNNERILKDYLLKSLKHQTVKFDLIKIDNTTGKFKSAANALNYGGKKANGAYIMFVHQDVDLSSHSWLEDAEELLGFMSDLGIAGVAGMSERNYPDYSQRMRSIIKHGSMTRWGNKIENPEPVQTLDECLIIIPQKVFKKLEFDEKTCNDWHLYATDYCLSVRELGFAAYVIPMYIYHQSTGNATSPAYYQSLKKVLAKHQNHAKRIYKPNNAWTTSIPLILQRMILSAKVILMFLLIKIGVRYIWRKSGFKGLWIKFRQGE